MPRTIIEPKPLRNLMQTMVGQVVKALKEAPEGRAPTEKTLAGWRPAFLKVKSRLELSGLYEFEGDQMVSVGAKVKAKGLPAAYPVEPVVNMGLQSDVDREGAGEVTFYFEIEGSV